MSRQQQKPITVEQYFRMARTNAQNHHNGQKFEDTISEACEYYRQKRIAEIDKTPEPFHVTSRQGSKWVGFFAKKAQPDFKGVVRGGKAIIFEAKHTSTTRMARSVITDVQERKLDMYASMGATCFVLVSFGQQHFYNIPWDVFKNMQKHFGRKFFMAAEAEQYRIGFNRHGVLDFLRAE